MSDFLSIFFMDFFVRVNLTLEIFNIIVELLIFFNVYDFFCIFYRFFP